MSSKTTIERTLETLVELVDLQRKQSNEAFDLQRKQPNKAFEKVDEAFGRVATSIDALAINIAQTNAAIKQNSQNIDKVIVAIDRLGVKVDSQNDAINWHLKVAESQSANIAELTKLVATQAIAITRFLDRTTA